MGTGSGAVPGSADRQPYGERDGRRRERRDTPFGLGLPLGRWFGIPVRAHWSVLLALVLFTVLIATADLPATRPGHSAVAYWVVGALAATAFFLTLLAHELAHAVVARRHGVAVHRISLWMLGGLTELGGEAPDPRSDAMIAGAGPLTSLGLGGVLALVAALVGGDSLAITAVAWLAALNLLLGVFNLLPGAPLDGGRLLRAFLWWRSHDRERAAEGAAATGRVLGMTLVGLGLLATLAGSYAGLWTALVGWFILNGAASERYAARAQSLRGLTVRDALGPPPLVAPGWWTVEQLASHLTPELLGHEVFPLVDVEGRLAGVVALAALERVPPELRPTTRVRDLAPRGVQVLRVSASDDLADVLLPLHLRGGFAVVVDGDRPVSVITEADLTRAAQLHRIGWPDGQGGRPA